MVLAPGVVDQDVQGAELIGDLAGQLAGEVLVAQVAGQQQGLAASALDDLLDMLGILAQIGAGIQVAVQAGGLLGLHRRVDLHVAGRGVLEGELVVLLVVRHASSLEHQHPDCLCRAWS